MKSRVLPAWIAACAIVLQALWPLLSHARPAERSEIVSLCGIPGETHLLELKIGKQTPLEQKSASHGEHCKLCVFDGPKDVGPALVSWISFVPPGTEKALSSKKYAHSSSEVVAARPRAPPA